MGYLIPVLRPLPMKRQVLLYIIDHPGVTSRELADQFGIGLKAATTHTSRLQREGNIRRQSGPRTIGMRWEFGAESDAVMEKKPSERGGLVKQVTVTTWKPFAVPPQQWYSALGLEYLPQDIDLR